MPQHPSVKVRIKPTEKMLDIPAGTLLKDLARQFESADSGPIVAAKCDNKLRDLNYAVADDCQVEFVDLRSDDGQRIYQRSVVMILVKAAQDVLTDGKVSIEHSLSNGLYGEIHRSTPVGDAEIKAIEARMHELVDEDLPFTKYEISKEEAMEYFGGNGQEDKVKLLRYRQSATATMYTFLDIKDYFYGYMVPSTGYVQKFRLRFYLPGFILQIPAKHAPTLIPPYCEQPKLAAIYKEAERWGEIERVGYVGALNEEIEAERAGDLIRLSEALHEKKTIRIADQIADTHGVARVILIAGPSSSGKTTFAQRLALHLRVDGLRPVSISLDDYFLDRELTPKDENGNYDFESIEAIDLELFNEDLAKLIQGKPVNLPTFDFREGRRKYEGRVLQVSQEQPIILEGIHGLNDRLTESIPAANKFKIYVSCLTQLNLDAHNRIPTTDVRKIRRICRDHQFRNHRAESTLQMWERVRRGEERNIFPFQENADVMFNSALPYELAVLKPIVDPLLQEIDQSSQQFAEARRLLKFLGYFLPLSAKEVPATSIIQEFVGHSAFS